MGTDRLWLHFPLLASSQPRVRLMTPTQQHDREGRSYLMPCPWFSSVTQSCPTLCDPMDCSISGLRLSPTPGVYSKLMSIESVMPSNHLILSSPSSPAFSLSQHQGLAVLHIRWPKYWSFSISPSSEYSGLISFRMDWLDLLAVQGTLKSLLQHPSSKASILQHSAFFIVQLSHPYLTTGKTQP